MNIKYIVNEGKRKRLQYVLAKRSDNQYNTTIKIGRKEENIEIKNLNCSVNIIDGGNIIIIIVILRLL